MGRLLALWRFRRGVSAVRCLLYLNAKMRRLRALWKFRRSATVAAMVGRSWIRRAKEIHFGKAIERMQACGRGQVARLKARKMRAAKLVLQAGGRGFLGRVAGRRVKKERAAEIARKKKEERERKIRERKEAMEAKERDAAARRAAADATQKDRMQSAAAKYGRGGGGGITRGAQAATMAGIEGNSYAADTERRVAAAQRKASETGGGRVWKGRDGKMKFSRKEMGTGSGVSSAGGGSGVSSGQGDTASMGTSDDYYDDEGNRVEGTAGDDDDYDDDLSEGSDLLVADSDEEDGGGGDGGDGDGISDPRQLLAATKALDAKEAAAGGPGAPLAALPNLDLTTVGGSYDDDNPPFPGSQSARARATPSMLSRLKNKSLGSMTPRSSRGGSGFFSARRGSATDGLDGKRLLATKTAKGSLVACGVMRVAKQAGQRGDERFVLIVGDVVFVFVLATQPEVPLGLRMWPERVVCLNQSALAVAGSTMLKPTPGDGAVVVAAKAAGLGALVLSSPDDPSVVERFSAAMSLGVANVRRARQQAKLSMAQQMCHEKKLSLLKTQHMIELLHKSQEMFFEAGSGQFDDCNAVCMHSGVMRQSLIDVTPFMPVSDFICEYCACVIVLEEQADAVADESATKGDGHKATLKAEQARKLQLDDETLMVARDVRVLRQRRKAAEDEAATAWTKVQQAIEARQAASLRLAETNLRNQLAPAGRAQLDETRARLAAQLAEAERQRNMLQASLEARQARLAGRAAAEAAEAAGGEASSSAAAAPAAAPPMQLKRNSSFGKSMTRVLSFGKSKKSEAAAPAPAAGAPPSPTMEKRPSSAGQLMRKLSFNRKKSSTGGA